MAKRLHVTLGAIALLQSATCGFSQDFRVYTTISSVDTASHKSAVIARSLTLFHAGKVYDHMEEVGELVIYEPVHHRFLLIKDFTATMVSFEELQQMLDVAHNEAQNHVQRLQAQPTADSAKMQRRLKFQLRPDFEQQFDDSSSRVMLSSPELNYDVKFIRSDSEELATQYLQYADWAARLNTVLHPQAMLPRPRLRLNETLREGHLLPTNVSLTAGSGNESITLKAEHEYGWQLRSIDKDLIRQWEELAASDKLQWVNVREYQRRLLATSGRHR